MPRHDDRHQTDPNDYFKRVDRALESRFRQSLQRILKQDVVTLIVLILLSYASVVTMLCLIPYNLLLVFRIILLWAVTHERAPVRVLNIYSPFEFHRTDRVRQYARLTEKPELAKFMLVSYAGLIVASVVSCIALVLFSVLLEAGVLSFIANAAQVAGTIFTLATSTESLYDKCVTGHVDSVLGSDNARVAYAKTRSRFLLDKLHAEIDAHHDHCIRQRQQQKASALASVRAGAGVASEPGERRQKRRTRQ